MRLRDDKSCKTYKDVLRHIARRCGFEGFEILPVCTTNEVKTGEFTIYGKDSSSTCIYCSSIKFPIYLIAPNGIESNLILSKKLKDKELLEMMLKKSNAGYALKIDTISSIDIISSMHHVHSMTLLKPFESLENILIEMDLNENK